MSTPASEETMRFAGRLLEMILEAVGVDGLLDLLAGHPLTKDKIVAAELAAGDTAVDALENAKAPAGRLEGA